MDMGGRVRGGKIGEEVGGWEGEGGKRGTGNRGTRGKDTETKSFGDGLKKTRRTHQGLAPPPHPAKGILKVGGDGQGEKFVGDKSEKKREKDERKTTASGGLS